MSDESNGNNGANHTPQFRVRIMAELAINGAFNYQILPGEGGAFAVADAVAIAEMLKKEVDFMWVSAKQAHMKAAITPEIELPPGFNPRGRRQ